MLRTVGVVVDVMYEVAVVDDEVTLSWMYLAVYMAYSTELI
jgi:hypothetical protein